MEKKYIATLDSKYALGQKLTIPVTINGEHTVWVRAGIELTPYTEPDLDAVRKEAYDEGYKKCLSEHDFDSPCTSCEIEKEAYQKGLDDAWETARKVYYMDGGKREQLFGHYYIHGVIDGFSASEAIERIKKYEQEQIKIGDEIEVIETRNKYVITGFIDNSTFRGFAYNGIPCRVHHSEVRKTGRHFPEIAEVLRKMRDENV